MIVVDAGFMVLALAQQNEFGKQARARILDQALMAPYHIDVEYASSVRGLYLGGKISEPEGRQALGVMKRTRIFRLPQESLLDRIWELRHNYSAYDAAYVALAEFTKTTLLTTDRRVARAVGARCDIEHFPAS